MNTPKKVDLNVAKFALENDMTYMQAKAWLADDNGDEDADLDGRHFNI